VLLVLLQQSQLYNFTVHHFVSTLPQARRCEFEKVTLKLHCGMCENRPPDQCYSI
jgi:cytochrome c-type biogenesis protein CcmH/NrfF